MHIFKKYLVLALICAFGVSAAVASDYDFLSGELPEAPKHEMRGAWLATVYGIDWPSKQGATAADAAAQRRELVQILDVLQGAGVNAVMFQVRSMADAMYPSRLTPWSQWLTGARGASPAEGWDPLKFAVDEAHARGMELHAWLNPFRLANSQPPAPTKVAAGSEIFDPVSRGWVISYAQTEKVRKQVPVKGKKGRKKTVYSTTTKWTSILDPGNAEVRDHIVGVCREIVSNYDVDGIVFDDYFYPDRLPLGEGYDYDEWMSQCAPASKSAEPLMSQADWRRDNVAQTIAAVGQMLRRECPWVRFGVSPAGVAGGNGAATQAYGLQPPTVGHDWMYDRIFCDPLRWLDDGSVDYVSPQIYWARNHETNPFTPLAKWWSDVAAFFGRHCFPSQKVLALPAGKDAWEEQCHQVLVGRDGPPEVGAGAIFYSCAHITGKQARGLAEVLKSSVFAYPALLPPISWVDASDPGKIKHLKRNGNRLNWLPQPDMRYVVYAVPREVSMLDAVASVGANFMAEYIQGITYGHTFELPPDKVKNHWYAVAPYDRYGNEWEASIIGY